MIYATMIGLPAQDTLEVFSLFGISPCKAKVVFECGDVPPTLRISQDSGGVSVGPLLPVREVYADGSVVVAQGSIDTDTDPVYIFNSAGGDASSTLYIAIYPRD